jgi:hypothetical protein
MSTSQRRSCRVIILAFFLIGCVAGAAVAQEPKSVALAKELATLLGQAKLDAIAAKDPSQSDSYVAALYFAGSQLLVVSARYSVPVLLNEKIAKKDYREIYIDLSSASVAGTQMFIVDLGADGLKPRRSEGQPFDTFETATKRLAFDSEWRAQKMTEDQYMAAFADADEKYAKMLTALITQAKKG